MCKYRDLGRRTDPSLLVLITIIGASLVCDIANVRTKLSLFPGFSTSRETENFQIISRTFLELVYFAIFSDFQHFESSFQHFVRLF